MSKISKVSALEIFLYTFFILNLVYKCSPKYLIFFVFGFSLYGKEMH
ncbi:hypothetical protein AO371_0926 [Moraxella catarrhalis]|nr:hypothetical protein AO371_0926 [Moraxella catarrhalis]